MIISGVFLHVMADALGSVIVIISAVIMWQTEWKYKYYVDPGLSILLVILILKSVWPLLIESALILLQTVPTHIQVFFNGTRPPGAVAIIYKFDQNNDTYIFPISVTHRETGATDSEIRKFRFWEKLIQGVPK